MGKRQEENAVVSQCKVRDVGMSEAVLVMAVSHQEQQVEPNRQGRGLPSGRNTSWEEPWPQTLHSHPEGAEKGEQEDRAEWTWLRK